MGKRKTEIYVLGILIAILGLIHLSFFATTYKNFLSARLENVGQIREFIYAPWRTLIGEAIYMVGCLVGMLAIFRKKTWGLTIAQIAAFLAIIERVKWLLIFGTYGEALNNFIIFGACALIIFYLSKNSIRKQFILTPKYKKLEKIFIIIVFLVMFATIGTYSLIIISKRNRIVDLKAPQKISYQKRDVSYLLRENLIRRELLNYSIYLPKDINVLDVDKKDNMEKYVSVVLGNPDKSIMLFISACSFWKTMPEGRLIYKTLGFDNPYKFEQKIFNEKVGIIYLILRIMCEPKVKSIKSTVFELTTDTLRGFLRKTYSAKSNTIIYDYDIYDRKGKSINIVFLLKENALSDSQREDIVSSLQIFDNFAQSANEFFEKGLELLNKNMFEEAKFYFANALLQNYDNAHYHYYLALALAKTGRWKESQIAVKKALDIKPDYPEAIELLKTVNSHVEAEDKRNSTP